MDAAVCLANTAGGLIIVGVDDKKTADAITPCPYPAVTVDLIRKWVWDLTKPPVDCSIARLSDVVPYLEGTPQGSLFIIKVQKTVHPSGHRTNRGVSFLRVDTECRPQYCTEQDDYSALLLNSLTAADLSMRSLLVAIKHRETRYLGVARAGLQTMDHLIGTNLVRLEGQDPDEAVAVPTVAALLLFGQEQKLKRALPSVETVLVVEASPIAPLTSTNWYNIQEGLQNCLPLINRYLSERDAGIGENVLTELFLNAYLHRCYRTPGPVQIVIGDSELEIRNPGGLLGSLTPETLLYDTPRYRNFLLVDAARQFGYCEKAGSGIDKVYYQLIIDGFDFPIFESDSSSFKVIIRLKRDRAFKRFIQDFAGGLGLKLTDLIVIKALHIRRIASMEDLSRLTQRSGTYMHDVLADLERRRLVNPTANGRFALGDDAASQIAKYDDSGQLKLF
jgi:ATP-dependent DNA helicase RecG